MGCAGYVVGGLRRLCGGSDSDNRASLSSTCTSLPTGTELGNKGINGQKIVKSYEKYKQS